MHTHVQRCSPLLRGSATADDLVALMDRSGVRSAVVSALGDDMPTSNDDTDAACRRHPGRLYGYVNLDPRDVSGSLAELEHRAAEPHFRGVKLHPSNHVYYPFLVPYRAVYARIEELGLPVLWHTGTYPNSLPLQIAVVARDFPGMPCVLGHFGLADGARDCFPAAALAANVYVDTSINPVIPLLDEWVARFGAERMLWGSDFPLYRMPYELAKLDHMACDEGQRALIAGGNARRLYRLDDPHPRSAP